MVDEVKDERPDGRSLRYQNRRTELLDAVMAHVLEHGVAGMSFRTLGQGVGVSHVTLRHHFGTKDELIAEIFKTIRRREPIPTHVEADDIGHLIRDLWRRWSEPQGERHFRLLFEAYGYALRQPERHQAFLDDIVSDWLNVISRFAADMGYSMPEADVLATAVLAQLRGLQMDLLTTGDRDRVSAALEQFIVQLTS